MKIYYSMTYLSVPGQPPVSASSSLQVSDFIFKKRNKILTLNNLYLDCHEDIL